MEPEILQAFQCRPLHTFTPLYVCSFIKKIQVLEGRPGPCTPANPTHRKQTKKTVTLAERTKFGPLVAFVSPTETLNIEQLFYLMRQNFMAASIKLCQPSVLWQQRLNFLKFHPPSFFSFPVTHKLLR